MQYNITARDYANNLATSSNFFDFIDFIDDPPIVTINSPTSSTTWDTNGTISWSITDEDSTLFNSTVYLQQNFVTLLYANKKNT